MTSGNLILNKKQTHQKITRIAFEIWENNYTEQEIVIAGVWDKGYYFAELLTEELSRISGILVRLVKLDMEKLTSTQSDVEVDVTYEEIQNKVVVLADDVLNTGKTIAFALKPFLNIPVKKLQIAVIVDRDHKLYPVHADYVGYAMATSLKQHVDVDFESESFGVYLQ